MMSLINNFEEIRNTTDNKNQINKINLEDGIEKIRSILEKKQFNNKDNLVDSFEKIKDKIQEEGPPIGFNTSKASCFNVISHSLSIPLGTCIYPEKLEVNKNNTIKFINEHFDDKFKDNNKKKRKYLNEYQAKYLNNKFEEKEYPNREDKIKIATELSINIITLENWFKNKRRRLNKKYKNRGIKKKEKKKI